MYEFILGTVFGAGLVLAIQTIRRAYDVYSEARWVSATNSSLAVAAPQDTCGCHFSWDDHERFMLEMTKPVNRVTPDTDWAK